MIDEALISQVAQLLRGRRISVLTGAGISTDSGIPGYRGSGSTPRTPMTAQEFLADESAQRRYWVGSHLGWRVFGSASPNTGHRVLAELESSGVVTGVITQNVDGLHSAAGSRRVVELHGAMRQVRCLRCGQLFDRRHVSVLIERENPWITVPEQIQLAPDGDVVPAATDGFVLPRCTVCEGPLKPAVVFFGEFVPPACFRAAESLVRASDALLVAGTSLVVNSGIRIVERARRQGSPVVIINREPTTSDARADLVLAGGTSETLSQLAPALSGIGRLEA